MKSIEWLGDSVQFIDQTLLPMDEVWLQTDQMHVVAEAIKALRIRGAPLIGIAAAYGVALAGQKLKPGTSDRRSVILDAIQTLASTRPTAVNLTWALSRMRKALDRSSEEGIQSALISEALRIHHEDAGMCMAIGEHGTALVPDRATIITHCNTGALATGGEGTAQSIITTSHRMGKNIRVFVDETRPAFQGARLTSWELHRAGIAVTLMSDSMAAHVMKTENVNLIVVGADRIASNGDVANKIGTYPLAIAARYHGIPFYVAAPTSTIDPATRDGSAIRIEERDPAEVTQCMGRRIAPDGIRAIAPVFDITPSSLITAIVTEKGVHYPPYHFDFGLT